MPLYSTLYAVGHFISALSAAVLGIYILTFRKKSAATWFIAIYVISFAATRFIGFILDSALTPGVVNLIYIHRSLMAGGIFLTIFAYMYHENVHKRESIIVLSMLSLFTIISYIIFALRTSSAVPYFDFILSSYRYNDMSFRGEFIAPLFVVIYIWSAVVFIRKTVRFSISQKRVPSTKQPKHGIARIYAVPAEKIVSFVRALLFPVGIHARACRAFLFATLIPLALMSFYLLALKGVIRYASYELFVSIGSMLFLVIFVVIYMNNSPQPTTFLFKITVIPLITALAVIGFMAIPANSSIEQIYEKKLIKSVNAASAYVLRQDGSYLPQDIIYIIRHPADDNVPSTNYEDIVIQPAGMSIAKIINEEGKKRHQANPRRQFRSINVSDPASYSICRTFTSGKYVYEVGLSYIEYRRYLGDVLVNYIWMALMIAAIVFILFPLFFYRALLTPLNGLMAAIESFDQNKLKVNLKIERNDEFGRIADSFNKMAHRLSRYINEIVSSRKKLTEYSNHLETMVDERTKELIVSNKGLRDEMEERKNAENLLEQMVRSEFLNLDKYPDFLREHHLTKREEQILVDLLNGFSNREIADQYGIAEPTAKVHTINIYRKFNVNSKTKLVKTILQSLSALSASNKAFNEASKEKNS
ncbi:MAG: HAMP domain-containing protein [Spirochaetes bacterium]|nr:HAMP domain-containing protein [Spirochaetota bacterium]